MCTVHSHECTLSQCVFQTSAIGPLTWTVADRRHQCQRQDGWPRALDQPYRGVWAGAGGHITAARAAAAAGTGCT